MRKSTIYIIEADKVMPNIIKLKGCQPEGNPCVQKISFSASLRLHKINQRNNPYKYFLSELMLYIPFRDEEAAFRTDNPGFIQDLYFKKRDNIKEEVTHSYNIFFPGGGLIRIPGHSERSKQAESVRCGRIS